MEGSEVEDIALGTAADEITGCAPEKTHDSDERWPCGKAIPKGRGGTNRDGGEKQQQSPYSAPRFYGKRAETARIRHGVFDKGIPIGQVPQSEQIPSINRLWWVCWFSFKFMCR